MFTRASLAVCLLLFCTCGLSKTVVVPSDKEIKPYEGQPGFYIISGGHLKEIYEQQRILQEALEKCQLKCGPKPTSLR